MKTPKTYKVKEVASDCDLGHSCEDTLPHHPLATIVFKLSNWLFKASIWVDNKLMGR